ncbi:putative integral plasma membrane [Phaeomoniella chlamydospora]|uniref:Putative integral plasma membrane n=1 Tax=Phaeomoniella chlamydospora TaxID=158046 RepID=A0A0G2F1G3_PHACM|nr:putative integral plasma membrane [Phaeomoniella chlamydospora]
MNIMATRKSGFHQSPPPLAIDIPSVLFSRSLSLSLQVQGLLWCFYVATLPWTLGCLALSPNNPKALRYRKVFAGLFFGTLVPLIYFFIQHKVHKVPGAYTTYAFFEWSLIIFDVAFDAVTAIDFEGFELVVKDVKGHGRGNSRLLKDTVVDEKNDKALADTFGGRFQWSAAFDAAADIYNGFVFWTMLTSLGLLVWSRLEAKILAWGAGLILSSLAKFANRTNNPVWPIMHAPNGGWNKTGFVLAVIAVLRSTRSAKTSGGDYVSPGIRKGSPILAGLGFGGVVFAMHSLLSDSSTMILWVWDGYPVRGPIAAPHGAWTIFAMAAGIVLGSFYPHLFGSWTAFGVGCFGAAFLTLFSHWAGFYGGLVLTVYIMGITPTVIASAVQHSPALTFGLGFLVYNFMVLFHVWVVAYAFVPGGPLVREHTDWIMTTMMILIGAGIFSSLNSTSLLSSRSLKTGPVGRKLRSYYIWVLAALQLFSVAVAYLRFPTNDYVPYHKDDKLFTAGIWTIHFSLDNDMWSSERRMRDAIKELEVDVMGLLESDLQRIIMGNRDTTQYLTEDLGMYVDYGPGPNKHTWGAALLSKFPIVNSTHHLLPSPVGELAPAIHATLDVYGELVDVFVFHSGQEEDPEDRRLQTEYLSNLMGSSPRPSVLLSYLVTRPLEGNYNTYVSEKSGMRDIDPTDDDRWCEYILYKGLKRTGYARVSRGTITDTEIQLGKFVVGQPMSEVDERIPEDQVPEGHRFPSLFRGEGVRGHRYHVFDEPRYFA